MKKNQRLWTEEDVQAVLCNPVSVGMGPYPALIDDEMFIQANVKLIKEMGPERYLRRMISTLRESLELVEVKQPDGAPTS